VIIISNRVMDFSIEGRKEEEEKPYTYSYQLGDF
jgi:hypothetical protein